MLVSPGATLTGRYRLGHRLGHGGFGEVFVARDLVTGAQCAIKVLWLRPEAASRPSQFLREARVAASIANDHIARVVDAGMHDDIPFIVMELLEGEDLGRRLVRVGAFRPAEAALFLLHVARALHAAHGQQIVHRDLKPRNMFLTLSAGEPWVKLLDFGTAKLLEPIADESSTLIAGTPLYMAPEQFVGSTVGPATDIFAFGMSAFHMLTAHAYYALEHAESATPFTLGALLMHGPRESARARAARYDATVPEDFDAWFARCTAADPSNRFPSSLEAHERLVLALGLELHDLETVSISLPRSEDTDGEQGGETSTLSLRAGPDDAPERDYGAGESIAEARSGRGWRAGLGPALVVAGLGATISLFATGPRLQALASVSLAELSAESADGTPDPAASSITGACRVLYSWTGTEMQVFVPEADGECDGGDISPLVMIVHDGGPFVTSGGNFKSYQYLQRHLAKNGFISASIAVRSEDAHETALNVVDLMVDFLTDAWRRAPLVDTDSVALVGHGRGTEVTRHIARQLEGHPLFVVRSIISLAPVVEGPALRRDEANAHLQLLLAGPSAPGSLPAGSSELARQDQLGSVLKVIEGGSGPGLVDGGGLLNDVVKGYALAFLAAEHYGIDTWYDQFIRGTRVPGFWTTPVHTAIELESPEHDQRTVARP